MTYGTPLFYDNDTGTWKEATDANWAASNNGLSTSTPDPDPSPDLPPLTYADYANSDYARVPALSGAQAVYDSIHDTFGNKVFQQPVRTLATAGAQSVVVVVTAYGIVAAYPFIPSAATSTYNAAVTNPVAVRLAMLAAGVATGAGQPDAGLAAENLFASASRGVISVVGAQPSNIEDMVVKVVTEP